MHYTSIPITKCFPWRWEQMVKVPDSPLHIFFSLLKGSHTSNQGGHVTCLPGPSYDITFSHSRIK